ncbi:MAG: hypothetical protein LBT42_09650 [Tannerella sp.]|jgi:hypothetical protein|nr:hypothetical protein [Tannerella sp.]
MILTNYFLNKEILKLTGKASARPHQYRSMNDIKSLLIICDSRDWDVMRYCVEKLRSSGKTVNTAIYSPTRKDVPTWVSNYLLLRGDSDVNLFGFPAKSVQQQFYNLSADVIIDFSGDKSAAMLYMILKHPSAFKVGVKRSENPAYDFSIIPPEGNDDIKYLFDQILGYLQSITSKYR